MLLSENGDVAVGILQMFLCNVEFLYLRFIPQGLMISIIHDMILLDEHKRWPRPSLFVKKQEIVI